MKDAVKEYNLNASTDNFNKYNKKKETVQGEWKEERSMHTNSKRLNVKVKTARPHTVHLTAGQRKQIVRECVDTTYLPLTWHSTDMGTQGWEAAT